MYRHRYRQRHTEGERKPYTTINVEFQAKVFRLVKPFPLATISSDKCKVFLVQAVKAYGSVELGLISFLTSTASGQPRACPLYVRENNPCFFFTLTIQLCKI